MVWSHLFILMSYKASRLITEVQLQLVNALVNAELIFDLDIFSSGKMSNTSHKT
ncbi:MAG: hypothetical protein ACJA2G_002277 [Cognaticolwellia sp.]|jgi:hypothetical protein